MTENLLDRLGPQHQGRYHLQKMMFRVLAAATLVGLCWSDKVEKKPVTYDLWTTPTDDLTENLLDDLFDVVLALQDSIAVFTPHFMIHDGLKIGCERNGREWCKHACTNRGRYCADMGISEGTTATGAQIVTESLRRICIWNVYGKKNGLGLEWWEYNRAFNRTCDHGVDEEGVLLFANQECVDKAMEAAAIDKEVVENCMEESGGLGDSQNRLLRLAIVEKMRTSVANVPSIFVHGSSMRGFAKLEGAFKMVCAGFRPQDQPIICRECAHCKVDPKGCLKSGVCQESTFMEEAKEMEAQHAASPP